MGKQKRKKAKSFGAVSQDQAGPSKTFPTEKKKWTPAPMEPGAAAKIARQFQQTQEVVGVPRNLGEKSKERLSFEWTRNFEKILASIKVTLAAIYGDEAVADRFGNEIGTVVGFEEELIGSDGAEERLIVLYSTLKRLIRLDLPVTPVLPLQDVLNAISFTLSSGRSNRIEKESETVPLHYHTLSFARDLIPLVGSELNVYSKTLTIDLLSELEWTSQDSHKEAFRNVIPKVFDCLSALSSSLGPGSYLHKYSERLWKAISANTKSSLPPVTPTQVAPNTSPKKKRKPGNHEEVPLNLEEQQASNEERKRRIDAFNSCTGFVASLCESLGPFLNPGFMSECQRLAAKLGLDMIASSQSSNSVFTDAVSRKGTLKLLRTICLVQKSSSNAPLSPALSVFSKLMTTDPDPEVRSYSAESVGILTALIRPMVHSLDFFSVDSQSHPETQSVPIDSRRSVSESTDDGERNSPPSSPSPPSESMMAQSSEESPMIQVNIGFSSEDDSISGERPFFGGPTSNVEAPVSSSSNLPESPEIEEVTSEMDKEPRKPNKDSNEKNYQTSPSRRTKRQRTEQSPVVNPSEGVDAMLSSPSQKRPLVSANSSPAKKAQSEKSPSDDVTLVPHPETHVAGKVSKSHSTDIEILEDDAENEKQISSSRHSQSPRKGVRSPQKTPPVREAPAKLTNPSTTGDEDCQIVETDESSHPASTPQTRGSARLARIRELQKTPVTPLNTPSAKKKSVESEGLPSLETMLQDFVEEGIGRIIDTSGD